MRFFIISIFLSLSVVAFSQPIIYTDAQSIITGTWASSSGGGTASIQEVTTQNPHEGTFHYQFDYDYAAWWAGCGLNLDNWGASAAKDFSGYSHIRMAFRGLSGSQELQIQVRNGTDAGNALTVGTATTTYTVVDIPITALTVGSAVNANAITEIQFNLAGVQTGIGTVYLDAIELVNLQTVSSPASAATWARANSVVRGVNTANWLEAHWLIPFNAFPEVNKYTCSKIFDLRLAGFEAFRLPITFERITPTTPPYTVDFNHVALQLVDSMILWAHEMDFKLIIDNHHGYELTDANYVSELPRLQAIWAQLAAHYGALDPERYLFEVYNEAHAINNTNLKIVYDSLLTTVRTHEAVTHSVLLGASGYNSGGSLTSFIPMADSNIIYTFHNYDPYFFTHQGMSWTTPPNFAARTFPQAGEVNDIHTLFAAVKAWSDTYDVPIWLGEYGVSTAANDTSRCNWIETLANANNLNGFAHFYWDAISPTDAFGFYTGGTVSQGTAITCFATEIGLYNSTLAVEYVSLDVHCKETSAEIQWEAYASDAHHIFQLETSENGLNWSKVDEIQSEIGAYRYQFEDTAPSKYYRIKTLDALGQVEYSDIRQARCTFAANEIAVFPNPAHALVQVQWNERLPNFATIEIHSISGRLVKIFQDQSNASLIQLADLKRGTYFLTATFKDGSRAFERLIMQ